MIIIFGHLPDNHQHHHHYHQYDHIDKNHLLILTGAVNHHLGARFWGRRCSFHPSDHFHPSIQPFSTAGCAHHSPLLLPPSLNKLLEIITMVMIKMGCHNIPGKVARVCFLELGMVGIAAYKSSPK